MRYSALDKLLQVKGWKHSLAFLISPLGTPVCFALWNGVALAPRSLSGVISSLPKFVIYTAPAAYIVTLLFGIPAILVLSRRKRLAFPAVVYCGTVVGTITGLFAGFYIAGCDINEFVNYFTFDVIDIYAPSAISGMICAVIYCLISTTGFREKG